MNNKLMMCLLLLSAAVFGLSCSGKGKAKCGATKAKVVDYAGLDGCGLLLETEDGKTFSPFVVSAPGMGMDDLKNAREVRMDYREIKGIMSICMKGKSIEITCMKITKEGKPEVWKAPAGDL